MTAMYNSINGYIPATNSANILFMVINSAWIKHSLVHQIDK